MSCYKAGLVSFIIQLILSSVFAQDGEKVKMQIISNDFFTLPQQLDLDKTGHLLFSGMVNREGRQYIHIVDPIHLGVEKEPYNYIRGNYISKGPDTLVTFSLNLSTDVYEPFLTYKLLRISDLQTLEKENIMLNDEVSIWCSATHQYAFFRDLDKNMNGQFLLHLNHPSLIDDSLSRSVLLLMEETLSNAEIIYLDTVFDHSRLLGDRAYLTQGKDLFRLDSTPIKLHTFEDSIIQIEKTDSSLWILCSQGLFIYDPINEVVSETLTEVTSLYSEIQQLKYHSSSDFAVAGINSTNAFQIVNNQNSLLLLLDSNEIVHDLDNYIFEYDSSAAFLATQDLYGQTILYRYDLKGPIREIANHDVAFIGFTLDSVRPEFYVEDEMTYNYGFYYRVNFEVENLGSDTLKSVVFHANREAVTCQGSPPWHSVFEVKTLIPPGGRSILRTGEIWDPSGGLPREDYEVCFLINSPNVGLEMDTLNNTACGRFLVTSTKEREVPATFSVYPNPTLALVHMDTPEDVFSIEIIDMQGQILRRIYEVSNTLDLSNVATGMYTIRMISHSGNISNSRILKIR